MTKLATCPTFCRKVTAPDLLKRSNWFTYELPYDYLAVLVELKVRGSTPTVWIMADGCGRGRQRTKREKLEPMGCGCQPPRKAAMATCSINMFIFSSRVDIHRWRSVPQHLIADGMEIGTARDPYRHFVYTFLQESPPTFRTGGRLHFRNNDNDHLSKISALLLRMRPGTQKLIETLSAGLLNRPRVK